jgi:Pvc16 N-terminal domain
MASAAAIQAVTEATIRTLKDAPRPAAWPELKVVALRGQDFASLPADLPPDAMGVSLFLWRVGLNAAMRNRRNAVAPDGSRHKPPIALDLMYLISAWGKAAIDQHLIMGWALRALADLGSLPRGLLNSGTMGEVFASGEAVELVWEPLPPDLASPISDLLKPNWPPTVMLVVRGVTIDSAFLETPDGPPVQARAMAASPWSQEREGVS